VKKGESFFQNQSCSTKLHKEYQKEKSKHSILRTIPERAVNVMVEFFDLSKKYSSFIHSHFLCLSNYILHFLFTKKVIVLIYNATFNRLTLNVIFHM